MKTSNTMYASYIHFRRLFIPKFGAGADCYNAMSYAEIHNDSLNKNIAMGKRDFFDILEDRFHTEWLYC